MDISIIKEFINIPGYSQLCICIDIIIGKQNSRLKYMDVKIQRGAECRTDHHLLRAKIFFPWTSQTSQKNKDDDTQQIESRQFNTDSLRYLSAVDCRNFISQHFFNADHLSKMIRQGRLTDKCVIQRKGVPIPENNHAIYAGYHEIDVNPAVSSSCTANETFIVFSGLCVFSL
nr:unnamed protein product [Callosobruchus chinensis]